MKQGGWLCVFLVLCPTPAPADPAVEPPAAPPGGWVCFEPRLPVRACPKVGRGLDENFEPEDFAACQKKQRTEKPRPWRFRVGQGPRLEASQQRWRCVPVPIGARVLVEFGEEADHVSLPAECPKRRLDVVYNDFYGGMQAHCSRRQGAKDELLADYPNAARPTAEKPR